MVHQVELSLFPNWVGVEQERLVEVSEDTLTLSTRPLLFGGEERTAHLIWKAVGAFRGGLATQAVYRGRRLAGDPVAAGVHRLREVEPPPTRGWGALAFQFAAPFLPDDGAG